MVLVTWIFVKSDSHEQQFFDVLENTKAIHASSHMAGWAEQNSNLKSLTQFISLLTSQKLIVFLLTPCGVDTEHSWMFDWLRCVVKCVVRCFQREPWSGHKDSSLHGLHCPISSNDCSFVEFLSKIPSVFASLWFILIIVLQFLMAEMPCTMT